MRSSRNRGWEEEKAEENGEVRREEGDVWRKMMRRRETRMRGRGEKRGERACCKIQYTEVQESATVDASKAKLRQGRTIKGVNRPEPPP